jgi:hypothetical protein
MPPAQFPPLMSTAYLRQNSFLLSMLGWLSKDLIWILPMLVTTIKELGQDLQ